MTVATKGSLFGALHNLADELQVEKTAAANGRTKQASPTPADPGGYQGATTHPTKDVDNNVQESSEGARSSENTSDVKSDQGAPSVDSTSEASHKEGSGDQDSAQLNIGTQQSATGEDSSVEDDYKGGKEDPGTTHPAATDNSSLDGHKYASVKFAEAKGQSDQLSNEILADLANFGEAALTKQAVLNPSAAGDNPPAQPKVQQGQGAGTVEPVAGAVKEAASGTPSEDGPSMATLIEKAAAAVQGQGGTAAEIQQGYELAAALGVEKTAAQTGVADCIEQTIRDASLDADLFGSFVTAFSEKKAMDEAGGGETQEGEDHSGAGDDASGAGGGEGAAPTGEGGGDPLGAGGGGGGGGGSLGDLLGGGADPGGLAGGGGDPAMGGEPSEEEALMELVAALDELGIPIEALAQAGGGEMGGGAPPMGGGDPMGGGAPMGPPPEAGGGMGDPLGAGSADPAAGAPPMTEGMKLASAALNFKRSGKYRVKEAADGTRQRQLRDTMKSHILEVMGA